MYEEKIDGTCWECERVNFWLFFYFLLILTFRLNVFAQITKGNHYRLVWIMNLKRTEFSFGVSSSSSRRRRRSRATRNLQQYIFFFFLMLSRASHVCTVINTSSCLISGWQLSRGKADFSRFHNSFIHILVSASRCPSRPVLRNSQLKIVWLGICIRDFINKRVFAKILCKLWSSHWDPSSIHSFTDHRAYARTLSLWSYRFYRISAMFFDILFIFCLSAEFWIDWEIFQRNLRLPIPTRRNCDYNVFLLPSFFTQRLSGIFSWKYVRSILNNFFAKMTFNFD